MVQSDFQLGFDIVLVSTSQCDLAVCSPTSTFALSFVATSMTSNVSRTCAAKLSNSLRRRALHATSRRMDDYTADPRYHPSNPPPDANDIIWTTHRLNKEQIAKVDQMFHKILWLDIVETAMLTESINKKLGHELSPSQRQALQAQMEARADGIELSGVGGANTEEAAEDEGPQLVELKLVGFDAKAKIKVIKEVRSIAGLGLKESKELVEGVPKVIQKDLKPEQAEELKAQLDAVGAQVEIS